MIKVKNIFLFLIVLLSVPAKVKADEVVHPVTLSEDKKKDILDKLEKLSELSKGRELTEQEVTDLQAKWSGPSKLRVRLSLMVDLEGILNDLISSLARRKNENYNYEYRLDGDILKYILQRVNARKEALYLEFKTVFGAMPFMMLEEREEIKIVGKFAERSEDFFHSLNNYLKFFKEDLNIFQEGMSGLWVTKDKLEEILQFIFGVIDVLQRWADNVVEGLSFESYLIKDIKSLALLYGITSPAEIDVIEKFYRKAEQMAKQVSPSLGERLLEKLSPVHMFLEENPLEEELEKVTKDLEVSKKNHGHNEEKDLEKKATLEKKISEIKNARAISIGLCAGSGIAFLISAPLLCKKGVDAYKAGSFGKMKNKLSAFVKENYRDILKVAALTTGTVGGFALSYHLGSQFLLVYKEKKSKDPVVPVVNGGDIVC